MRFAAAAALALVAIVAPAAAFAPTTDGQSPRGFIAAVVSDATRGSTGPEREALQRLYQRADFMLLWLDSRGRPSRNADDALTLLNGAAGEGLVPDDYDSPVLGAVAAALRDAEAVPARAAASWDVGMSAAVLRYLRDLHRGRIEPRSVGWRVEAGSSDLDFATLLGDAIAAQDLIQAAAGVAPKPDQYRRLRATLARYRTLADSAEFAQPLPALRMPVRRGDPFEMRDAVQQRLVALGDMRAAAPLADTPLFDEALAAGIKRFQSRHGLQVDGILGKATWAAINTPLTQRVRQIELAMERLRWLPDLEARRTIAINIPTFRLWALEPAASDAAPPLAMAVIVGRALNTQTPVFYDDMTHLIFRPYWNVPRSIVRSEILPALARDASYLLRHEMEIVRGAGDDATPVDATPETVALLRQGALRLRQRPGPRNSLGLVKFVFPNDADVYMHGTPSQGLFARTRRDFSHGCVRVEDPAALAAWALRNRPEWTRERIEAAMAGTRPLRVELREPVQVILFYSTAVVMPGDPVIHFADDIYRHDERLQRALESERARRANSPRAHPAGVDVHER